MKLKTGKRVYVPSTKTFGTIVRQGGILGLTSSYAVVDDVGERSVFLGNNMEFVYVDSSQKPGGEAVKIPPDVVPELRKKYSPGECKNLTVDLYKTDLGGREEAYRTLMKTINPDAEPAKKNSDKTAKKNSSIKTADRTAEKNSAKTTKKNSDKNIKNITTEDKRPATRKRARG